ncbi:MAG: hypothetical protein GY870_03730 [archaeon]|nr:hypothetical protein [archaeon]
MTIIYGQLRVSCGLSAIINSLQPQDLKISSNETFAHWLDSQWLRLTKNENVADPLVNLCVNKEHKWVAVLDYLLLRKIRSSFLLCNGISPSKLTTEVEYEDLDWNTLNPVIVRIISRLNEMNEDWILWHYNGNLTEPEKNIENDNFRKNTLTLIQSIKLFYEIYHNNITVGLEADWKFAIDNLMKFPEKITNSAIVSHLDYFKTDFELTGLLQLLGINPDYVYGRSYPKKIKSNSIILINRPDHWVCEDINTRGVILDSLTMSTDSIYNMDSFNYFHPEKNMKIFKDTLHKLVKIFPDITINIKEEDLTEFPSLLVPITQNPIKESSIYHERAKISFLKGDIKNALLEKRMECALLKTSNNSENNKYFLSLIEFTEWCLDNDKPMTIQENLKELSKLMQLSDFLEKISQIKYYQLVSSINCYKDKNTEAILNLNKALKLIFEDKEYTEQSYEIFNKLGVLNARQNQYSNAIDMFSKAKNYAQIAIDTSRSEIIDDLTGPPKKNWSVLLIALEKKIEELQSSQ